MRTLGSVRSNSKKFQSLQQRSCAKEFKNCTNAPLVTGDDHEMIISLLPPPELHLLLRVTNKLYSELVKKNESVAKEWSIQVGLTRPNLHSGEFNGNMCRRLLKKKHILKEIILLHDLSLLPFHDAFFDFNLVVDHCFGLSLNPDFGMVINQFMDSYFKLGINVTTAAHMVMVHVRQFCSLKKCSLGKYGEQASEAVHTDFDGLWIQCGKVSRVHPSYTKNLLETVVRYNGRHL